MASAVGKDSQGTYWFRSGQKLVTVSQYSAFTVSTSGFWLWKKWNVYGHKTHSYQKFILGEYKTEKEAATALENLMYVKGIETIIH